jgi:biopolymer transport protein TolR
MSQINVVPYIDVMLVLLVIFMVAAPMLQPSVVNLPSVDKADKEISEVPIRIDIKGEGEYELLDKAQQTHYQIEAELIAHISQILQSGAQRPVVIAADKSVRYELVMNTMNALKRAKVTRVGLLVQPK